MLACCVNLAAIVVSKPVLDIQIENVYSEASGLN